MTPIACLALVALLGTGAVAQGIETRPLDEPADEGRGRGGHFMTAPRYYDHPKPPAAIETVPIDRRPGAVLRQLDKMTGATRTVTLDTGETAMLGRLSVRLGSCEAPEDGAAQGTRAFLQIRDTRSPGADHDFSGWMFADSPALSALDHPRYDVWVIRCTIPEGGVASSSE